MSFLEWIFGKKVDLKEVISRSASARRILKSNGFEQVYNGGSWYSLRKYMS